MIGRGWVGLGASLALHAGAGALLLLILQPSDVPPQAAPKAEMTLKTASVTQADAVTRDAKGAEAASVAPKEGAAFSNPVPRRKALASEMPKTRIAAVDRASIVLEEADVGGDVAPSVIANTARPVAAASSMAETLEDVAIAADAVFSAEPVSVDLAAALPRVISINPGRIVQQAVVPSAPRNRLATGALIESEQVVAARPKAALAPRVEADATVAAAMSVPAVVTAGVRPDALRPAVFRPTGQRLLAGQPSETRLGADRPDSPAAREGAMPDQVISAAMAFSGGGEMSLDPAALLAFTAFVAPEQAGGDGQELRDGIASVLSAVPCARLQTAFNAETGVLELRGHVPEAGMRATLTDALRVQIDNALPVAERLQILPEPQCGTLGQVASLGVPQSEEQFTDPALIGENLFVREYVFAGGDRMVIDLEGADYPAFLYVDYFDAEGNVLHLMPNEILPPRAYAPGETFRIGAEGSGLELIVEPPFGQDIAVALASDRPLYEGVRPIVEPAAVYLEFMRARIAAVAPERAEWVYLMVQSIEAK